MTAPDWLAHPVVLLTLPDMAMADRMAQPLRSVAGLAARWFDAARAQVAAQHPHVVCVDIASRHCVRSKQLKLCFGKR